MASAGQLVEGTTDLDQQEPIGNADEQESQDYGEANENIPEDLKQALVDLARKFCSEDRYSRRMEVQECRRARFYWRGMQHLYWNYKAEGWEIMGPGAPGLSSGQGTSENDSSVLYTTNLYQAFGLSLQAVLTQNIPGVRFEPQNANDAADIETAKAADNLRKIVEHQNDAVKMLTEISYFAFTDGRIGAWSRFEMDKRTGLERNMITLGGALELKVPITTGCQEDYVYAQWSDEYHVALIKEEVSKMDWKEGGDEYVKKIKGGASGNGQDVYERTARISVKQGVSLLTQSGDTLSHLVTRQQTWMRPSAFWMAEDSVRKRLDGMFPDGCRVRLDNGVYTGSWVEKMDDHLAVMHPLPGDGQFRNSMGFSFLSVQERFNDIINITQDVYEKTIPAAWIDDSAVDDDGHVRQVSMPGARYPFPKQPNEAIAASFFFEPAATVSADMLEYAQQLMGPVGQFLTGAFPALFGGSSKNTDTASGYAMERDQAMGRIGLIWRAMKRFWAKIMEQAVRIMASQDQDAEMGIPSDNGEIEKVSVRIEQLQGKIFCYPDTDENFPESWTQKRAAYMALLPMADQNPMLAQILEEPENLEVARKLIGLEDFDITGADARDKQLTEINLMLKSSPVPNPAYAQLQQKLKQMVQQSQMGMLHPDPALPALEQQLQTTQPLTSSIQVDPIFDDNVNEFKTVQRFLNSAEGQKAKTANPKGFMNVRLHGLEHKAAIAPPVPMPAAAPQGVAA